MSVEIILFLFFISLFLKANTIKSGKSIQFFFISLPNLELMYTSTLLCVFQIQNVCEQNGSYLLAREDGSICHIRIPDWQPTASTEDEWGLQNNTRGMIKQYI